jgi:hypothetical protein
MDCKENVQSYLHRWCKYLLDVGSPNCVGLIGLLSGGSRANVVGSVCPVKRIAGTAILWEWFPSILQPSGADQSARSLKEATKYPGP